MAYDVPQAGTLKRKRRRREDKPALSARLYLDSGFKGDAGVLSEELLNELYPGRNNVDSSRFYAAVTIWTPHPTPADCKWAILPFRILGKDERALPASTIRFPAGAPSTQSFVAVVQAAVPTRTLRVNAPIEVRISDVVPLPLQTVFVSVNMDELDKMEDVQRRYGGGFMNANGYTAPGRKTVKRSVTSPIEDDEGPAFETKRNKLVHTALSSLVILHTDDLVPLPISHPVTHVPAPPAKVLACEPVSQGLLLPTTTVVVVPAVDKRKERHASRQLLSPRLPEETEGEEDSSLETFYSASEESPRKPIVTSKSSTDMSNTDDMIDSSAEESNLSDDDEMISLARPGLADQPSGLSSALTSATPRPFGMRTGVSTPGSVFSNVTSTTVRGGQATKSKTFRAQGLLERIPNEMLHPSPPPDEDDEARVFVDAASLAKLGCFSGDWVRIEAVESHILPSFSAFAGFADSAQTSWRPVKVYTLPESMSKRQPRYQVVARHGRRDSLSSLVTNPYSAATMYLSPILLANLDQAENVSLSPLSLSRRSALKRGPGGRPGSAPPRIPPTASEVTLRKVVSPLSNERALNHTLFANLKEHFEHRQRIVKAGDLVAVPIDESLGRTIYEGDSEKDGSNSNVELLSRWSVRGEGRGSDGTTSVAWFLIEGLTTSSDNTELCDGADTWGGAASIDPTKMTMRQSGDDRRKLPPTKTNPWPYYLGVRKNSTKAIAADGASTGLPEAPQPYVSNIQRRMRELMSVSTSPRAVHLGLPPLALLLTSTQRSIGKAYAVEQVCQHLGMHYFCIDAYDITSESGSGFDTQAQGLLEARCERALECGAEHTAICIRHIDTLNSDRIAASLKDILGKCRVLAATTTDVDKIPDSVRALFTHELDISAPDEGEREGILRNIVHASGIPTAQDVDLASIAVKTAALVAGDLVDVVDRAIVARSARLESLAAKLSQDGSLPVTVKDITISGGASANAIVPSDFEAAVDFARKNFADAIGAPKIPNVQWSDVGGLTHVKDAVIETIQLPLSRPELFAKGLKKRSGILFYGPPGTGKTLLAKAIATEFSLNFFSVKGPELLNMYIGESEANVRRVFQRARDARPCVVFFDELDSVAPKRGNQGDSGGVMDRIVSQLLAELDGMSDGEESGGGVFVIGATNRPDLLDQALLRPGRFDKMLYLGISDTHEKQATILRALTRKFTLDQELSLSRVSETLPFTFTGADLYALCSDAMLKAITRSAKQVDTRLAAINAERQAQGQLAISVAGYFDHHAQPADLHVEVTEADFTDASRDLVPSVSLDELQHYERVRNTFEGATKMPSALASNGDIVPSSTNDGSTSKKPNSRPSSRPTSSWEKTSPSTRTNGSRRPTNPNINTTAIANKANHHQTSGEDEDEFIVRTDRLSLKSNSVSTSNGGIEGERPIPMSPTKLKGKGKAKMSSDLSGSAAPTSNTAVDDDEDLYD